MPQQARTVGVIGLGYGRAHIPGFQANGCRVVAVCQRNEAAARTIADRYGVPGVYARWEDLLAEAKPEIVVIATPPHLHEAIAARAFAQGAHVLCEKPVAMTRAEARRMVEAAARAGRVAMTGFNWRFPPAMTRLNAMVREGAVGRVFHVSARWFGGRMADETFTPTWRMDRAIAGHGAMGDMGVHLVDLIRWNFGEFRRLVAHAGVAYASRTVPGGAKPADAEDHATVLAELESGTEVTLSVSRVARGVNDHTLEAFGTTGAVAYRLDRDTPRWWAGRLMAASGAATFAPVAVDAGDADGDPMEIIGRATIAPLVARMLDAIDRGAAAAPSLEDGLRAQAVLDAVADSLARRAWVDVARS
ncbi:MAG: Gfo/Idh/MocA family oxidoreductase [Candidatus Rokubacteria bacterium]|nr:Gfo/Idh/MocA family oxidoreductase [Candidatus Rokubacteria bacterium]